MCVWSAIGDITNELSVDLVFLLCEVLCLCVRPAWTGTVAPCRGHAEDGFWFSLWGVDRLVFFCVQHWSGAKRKSDRLLVRFAWMIGWPQNNKKSRFARLLRSNRLANWFMLASTAWIIMRTCLCKRKTKLSSRRRHVIISFWLTNHARTCLKL